MCQARRWFCPGPTRSLVCLCQEQGIFCKDPLLLTDSVLSMWSGLLKRKKSHVRLSFKGRMVIFSCFVSFLVDLARAFARFFSLDLAGFGWIWLDLAVCLLLFAILVF